MNWACTAAGIINSSSRASSLAVQPVLSERFTAIIFTHALSDLSIHSYCYLAGSLWLCVFLTPERGLRVGIVTGLMTLAAQQHRPALCAGSIPARENTRRTQSSQAARPAADPA